MVHFVRKNTRDQVLQKHFATGLKEEDNSIIVLKEVPIRFLRKQKDYAFLTVLLKQKKIAFRWEIPEGVVFSFKDQRFKLNSVQKARDFLERFKRDFEEMNRGEEMMALATGTD